MLATKLREKTKKQLEVRKAKVRHDLEELRVAIVRGKEKNSRKVRNLKKEYARILTVLNEKRKK